jgi:S1-C subfamily serine protease
MVVTDVDPSGIAASAGIRSGDVITRVNDRDVTSMPTLKAAMAARSDKPMLVLVSRQGASLFLALPQARS